MLDAQRRYFDAQIRLSNALRDQRLARVQLYKALGGGWENAPTSPADSTVPAQSSVK